MRKLFIQSLILLLFVAFTTTYAQSKKSIIPDQWKKIEACGITFYAPSDLEEESVRIIDSCIRRFRSKNILLEVNLIYFQGKQNDSLRKNLSDEKEFRIVKTRINRRKSEIITYFETKHSERLKDLLYNAILFVPAFNKEDSLIIKLNCLTAEAQEIARKIFKTVRFNN